MLKRNKAFSIVMTLCLCLALLAPVFLVPSVADASSTYEALVVPTITASTTQTDVKILNAKVLITIPETGALNCQVGSATYDSMTISLPSGVVNPITVLGDQISLTVPARVDGVNNPLAAANCITNLSAASSANTWEIRIYNNGGAGQEFSGKGTLVVNFGGLVVQDVAGDLKAKFQPPLSGSGFTAGEVTIAKVGTSKGTIATAKDVKTFGDSGGYIDSLIIAEQMPGVFKAGDTIDLKLPSGYFWSTTACSDANISIVGGWGLDKSGNTGAATNLNAIAAGSIANTWYSVSDPNADHRTLRVTFLGGFTKTTLAAGRIVIGHSTTVSGSAPAVPSFAKIEVEDVGKQGDIEVAITSNSTDITEQDVIVAKCADFKVSVSEGTVEQDLLGGRDTVKIGKFYIEESIPKSLSEGKTIFLEILEGGKWIAGSYPTATLEKGNVVLNGGGWTAVGNDNKVIKRTIATASTIASKLCLENTKVNLDPSFEGDLKIKVYGSCGAEGEVKVATVKRPVTITATEPVKVAIGAANQKVADITITEAKKGAILDTTSGAGNNNDIVLQLDDAYKFASKPTVTVKEGDLVIDSVKLITSDTELRIRVKSSSVKVSTIEITDVFVTAFRHAPEGPVKVTLKAAKDANGAITGGSTALDEGTALATLFDKSVGNVVVANCVTPAAVEGTDGAATGQFKIGSNIYTVNGVAKVMDAAPYIKNERTYVPIRYLAYALGVAEADVVWDEATQKVTLTKGDNVVELTIGSTTITVNGEAQTMDVAPEINNDRTMLPARYVAEGLGAVVGWDPGTQTVLISK